MAANKSADKTKYAKERHDIASIAIETPLRGTLELDGKRVIIMTEQAYTLLQQVLSEYAPGAMKYAFYDMGYRVGVDLMSNIGEQEITPEEAFRNFVARYSEAGYGDIVIEQFDLDAPEVRLSGYHLFESSLAPLAGIYRTPRAVDHYSRGMFAGFLSELLRREVICEEIACQFRGEERCEFIILPFQI
jgi:predicted hydrocarbon binding protein